MRKIAIVKLFNFSLSCYDDGESSYYNQQKIIENISEFEEVDDETYDILTRQIRTMGNYAIVEQVSNQKQFILKSVADFKAEIKRQEKVQADYEAKKAADKAERALKRKAKTDTQEKELLKTLLKKHGDSITIPVDTQDANTAK